MKLAVIALSTAVVIASAPAVLAQGVSSKAPGHEMRVKAKKGHPGTSGYAGRRVQANGPQKGYPGAYGYARGYPGASGYAPTRDITDIVTQGGGGGGGGY